MQQLLIQLHTSLPWYTSCNSCCYNCTHQFHGIRRATVAATTAHITSMVYVVQQLLLQLHTSLPWYTSCNSCCYNCTHHFHGIRRATVAATTAHITAITSLRPVITLRHYHIPLPYAITTFHYLLTLQHAFATCHCQTLLPHAIIHFQFLTPCIFCYSVDIYQGRLSWFQDSQFLKDLENDSVDSDIIDEELGVLQEANTLT